MANKELPVVSFFNVLKNTNRILKNPLPFHRKNFKKHGNHFRVKLGYSANSVIFTRDALLAKHVFQKNHRAYYKSKLLTRDLAKYIGEGLLTANGQKWLQQRRLIQPAFHKKKLESLIQIMTTVIDEEISRIKPNSEIDVYPLMSDLAFKVVASSLFSYTGDQQLIARLQKITEDVQTAVIKEIRQPYKRWWFHLSGRIKNTLSMSKEARSLLAQLIQLRKDSDEQYDDLLDMLLESRYEDGTAMDEEQLIDEILILFVAGHETTSNALSFSLQLLANHPQLQQKVSEEVLRTKDDSGSMMESLGKLAYTKQCIEEAMRLYPPVYFADRFAKEDDTYDNFLFEKGSTILVSFFEIHRNPDFWKNPEEFNPDRFAPEVDKKTYADHYYPFGAGPRMCIGNNFAMYEMILTLQKVFSKYQITTSENTIEYKPLITLKPCNARISFKPRG